MNGRISSKKFISIAILLLTLILCFDCAIGQANKKRDQISVIVKEADRRVDILIDGSLFTSYIWRGDLKKPILYPINSARGTVITRGFPLMPRLGESVDHPHQVGLWLNYGDVNGADFWNSSIFRSAEEMKHMGAIVQRKIVSAKSGSGKGELRVTADWIMPNGRVALNEDTRFIFRGDSDSRSIDRITTLTAAERLVTFGDSKEGMFGMRVRRELEQPSKEPIALTDSMGKVSKERVLDNTNVSGEFRSSEGNIGDDVWGKRGRWALLGGIVGREPIMIAILDSPKNIGFPTHWMARGYGLFAANPFGQKAYASGKEEPAVTESKFELGPHRSVTFRYRVLILSRRETPAEIDRRYQHFAREIN
jgi:hypothetical protein